MKKSNCHGKYLTEMVDAVKAKTNYTPQKSGDGFKAKCPAHDDRNPSLLISETKQGHLHVKCMAGCEVDSVLRALDLKDEGRNPVYVPDGAEAVYVYTNEDGTVIAQKLRKKGKKFVWRKPDRLGGWVYSLKEGWYAWYGKDLKHVGNDRSHEPEEYCTWHESVEIPLYRAAEVKKAVADGRTIYFVEGEKDVESVVKLGLEATTTYDGAGGKWKESYGAVLKGAKVVIIPDQDEAGLAYAEKVRKGLEGIAAEVKLLNLPDLPEGKKDITDWIEAGYGREDLEKLVGTLVPAESGGEEKPAPTLEILDEAPPTICRPLTICKGRAYCATFVATRRGGECGEEIVVVRDDGQMIAGKGDADIMSLADAGMKMRLEYQPPYEKIWSAKGLKRYVKGDRVDPVEVLDRVVCVVDHFVDFDHGYASQDAMCELVGLYSMSTYLLGGLNVVGYLWPTGEAGSGKSQLLQVVCATAYLGEVVLAAGSFASLRDLADYGATIGFDDAENVSDTRRFDPDKRALMLAGNRRGTTVPLKQEAGGNRWIIRQVNAFCPRLFSAIRLPDPVLASRTIMVPMVRSADARKTKRSPQDYETWPCDRRRLIDDLFSMGLSKLTAIGGFDRDAAERSRLIGRDLEPWRSILAVALMLENHGRKGIFERIENLAVRYQQERQNVEEVSPARVAVICMLEMMKKSGADRITVVPSELAEAMNTYAANNELADQHGLEFTNAKKIGFLLKRLRILPDSRAQNKRVRILSGKVLAGLAAAYSVPCDLAVEHEESAKSAKSANHAKLQAPPPTADRSSATIVGGEELPASAGNDLAWDRAS